MAVRRWASELRGEQHGGRIPDEHEWGWQQQQPRGDYDWRGYQGGRMAAGGSGRTGGRARGDRGRRIALISSIYIDGVASAYHQQHVYYRGIPQPYPPTANKLPQESGSSPDICGAEQQCANIMQHFIMFHVSLA